MIENSRFRKMKIIRYHGLILPAAIALICFGLISCSSAQVSVTKHPADYYIRIADNFIRLYPDTAAYPSEAKSYRWNYEQGLLYNGFINMTVVTGDKSYGNYVKKNVDYYIQPDGTIKTYRMDQFNIDNIGPGRALLHLYSLTGDKKYLMAADTLYRQMMLHPRNPLGGYWHKKIYPDQMWLDGLYMAQPFLAEYAKMTGNQAMFDDIALQFRLVRDNMRDSVSGLYYHGWDQSRKEKWADPVTGLSPEFWGRSLGWFMMAMVDVLDTFPEEHPGRKMILAMFQDLSNALLLVRDQESGLWYQIVDKGTEQGNYLETSASLMFIYSMAKGANMGYLGTDFLRIAHDSFSSLMGQFVIPDSSGNLFLQNVCSVAGLGGKPYRNGSYAYYISEPKRINDFKGYGPLILAAAELLRGSR